jgi:hypothetical protein
MVESTIRTLLVVFPRIRAVCLVAILMLVSNACFAQWGQAFMLSLKSTPQAVPPSPPASTAEQPGPSANLFNNPYYTCGTNFYVAANGSDSRTLTQAQSSNTPWATLQHANDTIPNPSPNTCVNVSPGTYASGVALTKGGNLASNTGYLTYRCTIPSFISGTGCIITDNHAAFCFGSSCGTTNGPNYVIIDGFIFNASSRQSTGQGIQLWNGSINTPNTSAHHVWVLNNKISNYGQSGVQMNDGEYFYVIHNELTQNAYVDCGSRGSGISFVLPKTIAGYTPTADDTANSAMGLYGPSFPFKIVANWNISHINSTTTCGNSDGNGIIADSFHSDDVSPPVGNYPGRSLISFNIIYNNGGSGFQAFLSDNVTVANNSVYNNYLNTNISGTERSNLDVQGGFNNFFINNVSYSITGSGILSNNNAYNFGNSFTSCSVGTPCATAANNLSFCTGKTGTNCAANFNGQPAFSCSANKCDVNPLWVAVGNTSTGNDTVDPVNANFALQSTSQAIGYGQTQSYLSAQSVDAGACYHTLATCPGGSATPPGCVTGSTCPPGNWQLIASNEFNGSGLDANGPMIEQTGQQQGTWVDNSGDGTGMTPIYNGSTVVLRSFSNGAHGLGGNGYSWRGNTGSGYYEARLITDTSNAYKQFWFISDTKGDCTGGGSSLLNGWESDIMESPSGTTAQVNTHWGGYNTCHLQDPLGGFAVSDAFHTWGVMWPDPAHNGGITYFRDGVAIKSMEGPVNTADNITNLMCCGGINITGANGDSNGRTMEVDWVRYYKPQ